MMCRIAEGMLLLLASGVLGRAQSWEMLNPVAPHAQGLRLTNAGVFSGYSTVAMPNGSSMSTVPMGPDYNFGGEATISWNHSRPKTNASFAYTPSYMGFARFSDWNAFNHTLSFTVSRKLGRKWNLSFGVNGAAMSLSQSLFTPTLFSTVTAVGATFEDLAGAILSGDLTNNQLASLLTGAPVVESPARTLIYGNRVLTAAATTTLSYSPSNRLTIHLGSGASRTQYLNDGQDPETARYKGLMPRTISGNADAGMSYKLTPRTDFGIDANASRTYSHYQDAYTATAGLNVGRKLSRQWFVRAHGGVGKIFPVHETIELQRRPQFVGGGSIGLRTRAHTFLAAAEQNVSDSYGIGAGRTLSSTGSWTWHRTGGRWKLLGGGGWQRLETGVDLQAWTATGGIARATSRQTAVQLTYAYLSAYNSYGFHGQEDIHVHSIRLAFNWAPEQVR
jgi:hypothetical protein